jgi:hypothetical protein
VQTFLPYASFERSARCLDRQRLGKQRVETLQILKTLAGNSKGWQNHPAVTMWRGCESVLVDYGVAICLEWLRRGYKDTCLGKIEAYRDIFAASSAKPSWLGWRTFHRSHQSNLLRKAPEHYGQYFNVPADLEYEWPRA